MIYKVAEAAVELDNKIENTSYKTRGVIERQKERQAETGRQRQRQRNREAERQKESKRWREIEEYRERRGHTDRERER